MKKNVMILMGLLLTFSLYACSSGGGSGEDTVKLEIGLPGGYDITSKEIIDGFQDAHPDIELKAVEAPWGEYVQQIVTKIAGDTAPDLWFQENAVILGYGDRGIAEDLTPYMEEDEDFNTDDYVDALLATSTPDGTVYGVPHGINPIALAYNKRLFEEAGLDLPTDDWTYDDMIEAGEALTNKDEDEYGMDIARDISKGWYQWVRAGGGHILDDTLTETRLTEPETVEAVNKWLDARESISPSYDYKQASGGDTFGKETSAMTFLQYSGQINLNENFPELDYDTVQIPKAFNGEDRYVTMVVNSWVMYSKSDQETKDAAWKFLKYYLDDEAQTILAESLSSLPVKVSALEAVEEMTDTNPVNKKAYTEGIAESAVTSDENPTWQEWRGEAQSYFDDILDGVITPEEGLEEMAEKVQAILDENKE